MVDLDVDLDSGTPQGSISKRGKIAKAPTIVISTLLQCLDIVLFKKVEGGGVLFRFGMNRGASAKWVFAPS